MFLDFPHFLAALAIIAAVIFMALLDVPNARSDPKEGRILRFPTTTYPGHDDDD